MPDWSDHAAVAEFAARGAEILGDDPAGVSRMRYSVEVQQRPLTATSEPDR